MSELIKKQKTEEKISSEDYQSLIEKYQFNAKEIVPGKILKGKVIRVTPVHVMVDIGFKSEGIIPIEDFIINKEKSEVHVGDNIEAILERSDPKEGCLILSKKKADIFKALDNLEKAYNRNGWITGKIVEKIKNGYTVDVGLKTFLPDSHSDIRIVKEPEKLIGKQFKFKVIKFDRKSFYSKTRGKKEKDRFLTT